MHYPMARLVYRHNRITRLTHWINALALLILFMSGLQIFNAYPNLHWGSKAEPEEAFFSISAADDDGEIRGYTQFYNHRIDTTGFLGVQNTSNGPALRAFPSWLTIPGYFWLAGGRRWHFFFAWLFVINGLLYFSYNAAHGHISKFFFLPRDLKRAFPMVLYYLRLRRESPQEGEYNPLQKMAYTAVFFLLVPLIMLSGLALSPQMDAAFNWLPALFGGRQSVRAFHFLTTLLFASFTLGHIFMVVTTGIFNNMRSMISGWYAEKAPLQPAIAEIKPDIQEAMEPLPKTIESQTQNAEKEARAETEAALEEPAPVSNAGATANDKSDTETRMERPNNGEK